MKYINNNGKKCSINLTIDAFNKAHIIKEVIPYIKVHNEVLTKVFDKRDNWLTLNDISEYDKNPESFNNKLKKKEDGYIYDIKPTIYDVPATLECLIPDSLDALEVSRSIRDFIIQKINEIDDEYNYKLHPFYEYGYEEIEKKYDHDGNVYESISHKDRKHTIGLALSIDKIKDKTITRYFGPTKVIEINVTRSDTEDFSVNLKVIAKKDFYIVLNIVI